MNANLKRIALLLGILLLGCCILSAAVLLLVPARDEALTERDTAAQVQELAVEYDQAPARAPDAAAQEEQPTETDLPVSPAATATDRPTSLPTQTATATPSRTPRPTNTPRPTATSTATARPTNTSRPTSTPTTAATATPTSLPTATSLPGEIATVTGVIDGDTIIVALNGQTYRVRYIGIDTPETGEPCGSEATSANAALVAGQTVRMVRDVSETDRYDRLLRYVYVGDTFVNGELVAGGWADAVDYPPDTAMSGVLHNLENQANGRGCDLVAGVLPTVPVRGPEAPTALPVVPPSAAPPVAPTSPPAPQPTAPPPAGNCDPSYPTVCIPPPPPDLDCGQIPHRRFQVLPPDPHNFDGDHDGIGCESG